MELFFACLILIFALVSIYIILCKLYISMLCATGLSRKVARFQVFSAFGATGFSTRESELVMINSTRRKIITAAMITGYIFSILVSSAVIGVVISLDFSGSKDTVYFRRLGITLGISLGVLILVIVLTRVGPLRKIFYSIIKKIIYRHAILETNEIIFHEILADKYLASVKIFKVPDDMTGKTIGDFPFVDYGITILAVGKNNNLFTDNTARIPIQTGLELELYGTAKNILRLFSIEREKKINK